MVGAQLLQREGEGEGELDFKEREWGEWEKFFGKTFYTLDHILQANKHPKMQKCFLKKILQRNKQRISYINILQ